MKKRLKDYIVIIPLHLQLGYPCDYLDQTAHILLKNNMVIFFDFNNPSLFWESLKDLKKTFSYFFKVIQCKKRDRIYFRPFSIIPTGNIPYLHRLNRFLGIIQLRLILSLKENKRVIWGFDPLIEPVIGKLGEELSIYDCVDYLGGDKQTERAEKPEVKLFKKVSYIAFNSKGLRDQKVKLNPQIKNKSVVTYCGCSFALFQVKNMRIPDDLKKIIGKRIISAGNFDYRLDIKLLDFVTDKNPALNFVFIGTILKDVDDNLYRIFKKKNVHYLGTKDKTSLPGYYKNSDLGIIPYQTTLKFVRYSNPMKAYEYLASGIPVVSTEIEALKDFPDDLLYTTDNLEKFNQALIRLMKNWNRNKIIKSKRIALANSWEQKVARIEEFIINQSTLFDNQKLFP